jgi:hypothetical protein
MKDKVFDAASSVKDRFKHNKNDEQSKHTYKYTVKFDDVEDDEEGHDENVDKDKK